MAAEGVLTAEDAASANVVYSLCSRTTLEEVLWVFTDRRLLVVTRTKSGPQVLAIPLVNIVAATSSGERVSLFGTEGLVLHLKHTGSEQAAQSLAHSVQTMHKYFLDNGHCSALTAVTIDETVTAHGLPGLVVGQPAFIEVHPNRMVFGSIGQSSVDIALSSIDTMGVGGPGVVKTGGGFIGGGFGLEGMAIGIATASVLNLLTSRTRIETLLMVKGTTCEFVGASSLHTPLELDSLLAPAYTLLRAAQRTAATLPILTSGSVAEELTRLVSLREAGHITEEEYQSLKSRVIGS